MSLRRGVDLCERRSRLDVGATTIRIHDDLSHPRHVHDNAVIAGITGGALDANETEPGPIMLQGDHGKVSFRKVVVTPITRAGS